MFITRAELPAHLEKAQAEQRAWMEEFKRQTGHYPRYTGSPGTKAPKAYGRWVKVEGWRGGRVWQDADGRRTFYIRRTVKGVAYEINTGCTLLDSAVQHLVRFEDDPAAYKAGLVPAAPVVPPVLPLLLDEKRVEEFLLWSRDGKGNTPGWARKQQRVLAWWAGKLDGVDLRRVSLRDHILPALKDVSDVSARKRIIKSFYGWLRKETHEISAAEDPCFGVLPVPAATPAQRVKSKVVPREHVLLVRDALTAPWRDALTMQAATGWHNTEVARFAESGRIEPLHKSMRVDHGAVGVLVVAHKSGDTHRTAVSQEVIDAATRLRAHGRLSVDKYLARSSRRAAPCAARTAAWGSRPSRRVTCAIPPPRGRWSRARTWPPSPRSSGTGPPRPPGASTSPSPARRRSRRCCSLTTARARVSEIEPLPS